MAIGWKECGNLTDVKSQAEIKELVEGAYIHGAFNELNPEAMANGFHKDFAIFSAKGEELSRYEIEDWVAGVKKRQSSEEFDPKYNVWEHKFAIVDVTGSSAIAKVELSNDGKFAIIEQILNKNRLEWFRGVRRLLNRSVRI